MSFVLLLLTILVVPVFAQEILPAIQVEAKKEISDFSFFSSKNISTIELETDASSMISTHLEHIPGVVSNQNGGPGSRVSYFFRGTESRHVGFTLDGLKINDTSNNDRQFDSAFFTSPFLKEMDVHLGPQPVLFGSDAMGGIVELKTRKGESAPETRLTFNAGSFGTVNSSLGQDWLQGGNQGSLTFTKFRTDGISRLNKKRFNATERDSADITQISSSSQHQWKSKFQTDLLVSFLRGKNELDGFTDDNSHDKSENDQYILQQKTNVELTAISAISYRTGLNRHQRRFNTLSEGTQSYQGNLIQNEVIHRQDLGKLGLISGLSTDHEDTKIGRVNRNFDLHSLFIQSSLKLEAIKFQVGLRADHHTKYGEFYSSTAGALMHLGFNEFSVQYSQGYKAPSLYQLYGFPLSGSPVGNANLVPEKNRSGEASWKVKTEWIDGGVTLFQNRLSNLITYSNQGFLNQGAFITEGSEASILVKGSKVQIEPSFTNQFFRNAKTAVLRRPYNTSGLKVNFLPTEKFVLSTRLNWQDSRKDIDENGKVVKLNSYETVDLTVQYVNEKNDFGIQLTNVMNREYENLYGYNVMPRSIFFHMGQKL